MTSSEQFDNELSLLLEESEDAELATFQIECDTQAVEAALWATLEQLNITLAIGKDPERYDDDFEELHQKITQEYIDNLAVDDDDSEEVRDYKIGRATQAEWDEDWRFFNEMGAVLYQQQYTGLTPAEKQHLKKKAMAGAYVGEEEPERWIAMYDTLLEGEALNPEDPADQAILTAAEEELANYTTRPLILLFSVLARTLGVPADNDEPLNDYQIRCQYAARDLAEAINQHLGNAEQPNRHEIIYATIREYELDLTPDKITNILASADKYAAN